VIGESAFEYSMIETLDLPLGGNLYYLVPSGSNIYAFANALHVDMSRVNTWTYWNP
jgi:hypothetical protein